MSDVKTFKSKLDTFHHLVFSRLKSEINEKMPTITIIYDSQYPLCSILLSDCRHNHKAGVSTGHFLSSRISTAKMRDKRENANNSHY